VKGVAALAFGLIGSMGTAAAACFAVIPGEGGVSFEVKQAGAPFRGAFRKFGGEICLAGDAVSRIEVWLDPGSVQTGLPEIDAALKDKEFFAVNQHARIRFASRSVEARGDDRLAQGTLSIKEKRRDAAIPFRLAQSGGKLTVSGSFVLDRLQYDVGTGEWSDTRWLAAEVKIDFKAFLSANSPN
jgi:polyisoprenoid-binding protein YceI